MAATGKTPILLYGSTTATNTPVAGNLTNSADGCEIAINVADKNLFFKDATNTVNTVPIRQSSASSNGWLSSTDWNTFNNKASTSSPTFTGNVTLSTGNLVIGTSGKGITTGSAIPLGFGTNGSTTQATLFSSGGVSIGNTTDPGATNLSVTGTTTSASFIPTSSTVPTNGMYLRAANSVGFATNSTYRMGLSSIGQFGYNTSTFNTYFTIGGASQQYTSLATYPGTVQVNDAFGVTTLQNQSGIEFVGSSFGSGYGNKISGFDGGQLVFGARNNNAAWTEGMRMTNDPYLLIGYTTSNGAYKLQVNSQIFATSSTIATSDGRYKEDVKPIQNALDLVSKLNPVQFNWKKHPIHSFDTTVPTVGFIAQEVQEALKSTDYVDAIVKKNTCTLEKAEIDFETRKIIKPAVTEDFYGIAEGNMVALLTKALQELKQQFDAYVASHP